MHRSTALDIRWTVDVWKLYTKLHSFCPLANHVSVLLTSCVSNIPTMHCTIRPSACHVTWAAPPAANYVILYRFAACFCKNSVVNRRFFINAKVDLTKYTCILLTPRALLCFDIFCKRQHSAVVTMLSYGTNTVNSAPSWVFFRLTYLSGPNKVGLYVRPYVCPSTRSLILMKFGRWVMHNGVQQWC